MLFSAPSKCKCTCSTLVKHDFRQVPLDFGHQNDQLLGVFLRAPSAYDCQLSGVGRLAGRVIVEAAQAKARRLGLAAQAMDQLLVGSYEEGGRCRHGVDDHEADKEKEGDEMVREGRRHGRQGLSFDSALARVYFSR